MGIRDEPYYKLNRENWSARETEEADTLTVAETK